MTAWLRCKWATSLASRACGKRPSAGLKTPITQTLPRESWSFALLRPASNTSAGSLDPFAQVLAHKLAAVDEVKKGTTPYYSWYSMLLGLLECRRGNHAKALDWCRHSLETSRFLSLPTATDREIIAMCLHELGENTAARSELERASSIAERGLDHGFDKWYWREWVCLRLLLHEANLLMQEESSPKSTAAPR